MTRKTRRFLFYIFVVLFIVFAWAIILYSQGYSFDWQKKSLILTGAFYFKSYPKEADIYLNNEPKGETNKFVKIKGLLSEKRVDRFVKRLKPGEYEVRISKPDYYDWQKTLNIKSRLVTEAKNILLIKKNFSKNLVMNYGIKYLSFSNDRKKMVYWTDKTIKEINPAEQKIADPREISVSSQFSLRLLNLTNNIDTQIYPAPLVKDARLTISSLKNLSNISWSSDDDKLLLTISPSHYYIINLENPLEIIDLNNLIRTISKYTIFSIENPLFHPHNSNKIYFSSKNKLYFIELNNSKLSQSLLSPLAPNVSTYTIGNNILYLGYYENEFYTDQKTCGIYKANFEGTSFEKIFDIPNFKSESTATIINEEIFILDKNLYLFNPQTQILDKIAEGVEETILSEDKKKMLWKTNNEIGVIWLESSFEQPQREKYQTEVVMKTFEKINQALWYPKTNEHIIFVMDDGIKITELDGRDKRNTMDILSIKNSKVFYNNENNNLYILSDDQLYQIEF